MTIGTVGVDICKATFDAAHLGTEGKYKHKKFPNTPAGFAAFVAWLEGFGGDQPAVCMEATGAYSIPLAEFLAGRGWPVSVVNPARIHAFAKTETSRAKTDQADAKPIARFAQEKKPALWTPPPPAIRELQTLLRRVEDLLEMRQMEQNRLDTAGLAPRIKQSGQWTGKTRLSKTGDPLLRKALYMPAVVAWRHNPAIRAFCERLKANGKNGKNGKAVACAAMRKLVHIAFAILKSGKPFDPNFALA